MQKVLVTGATGFIGFEVSRQLAERGQRPRLMVRRPVRGLMLIPRIISHMGTRILDVLFGLIFQVHPYPSGAVSCWNLRLPVVPGTIDQTIDLEPKFPTIHDGIPAVLDDSISFY